ncbi:MAG: glycosyltransferase [Verrucomicrobia bacterium]|nr:glycosyltransferase [Verrucomicrobiota bacterium]
MSTIATWILGLLTLLNIGLGLWQWLAGRRFGLRRRRHVDEQLPCVTVLKPLKGKTTETRRCLKSWFQQYDTKKTQLLFGIADPYDPVCDVVRELMNEFPDHDSSLVICNDERGKNPKASNLIQLLPHAKHDILIVSDADVVAPPELIEQTVSLLSNTGAGLVNCLYYLGNAENIPMKFEAAAVNGDFWSQVLQNLSFASQDYALGAVMVLRRDTIEQIGGFEAVADYLADDFHLGRLVHAAGLEVRLSKVPVECRAPMTGPAGVWRHQVRWARTIRASRPLLYAFSGVQNGTLWPLLLLSVNQSASAAAIAIACLLVRIVSACDLQRLITRSRLRTWNLLMPLVKDIIQPIILFSAFSGNTIEWRGKRYKIDASGRLIDTDNAK